MVSSSRALRARRRRLARFIEEQRAPPGSATLASADPPLTLGNFGDRIWGDWRDRPHTAHLRYPLKHRRVWRSTNLLERSLGEVKRRTKVIGRFPGETSCLSLCWAALDLLIADANRVRSDNLDRQLIDRIQAEHDRNAEEEEVIAA